MAESMQGLKRTHRCGELSSANIGEKVTVMGWVQKNRNKGGIVFMDLRDRSGILQIVFEGEEQAELMEKASKLRSEFVVAVVGNVEKRSGAVNENLATGEIEVRAEELRILSESEVPPFQVEENSKTKEELRLKYRYLDLRRPDLQRNLEPEVREETNAEILPLGEGKIEFDHVTFGYKDGEKVLDDVSFTVSPGEMVAFVGATGAGKTTVVSLLERFYDPTEGRILFDGKDIRQVTLKSLRENLSIVLDRKSVV